MSSELIRAGDGCGLYLVDDPVPQPRALGLIVHGFGEHSGRYDHVTEYLNGHRVSVYRFDSRGHGRSGGRRAYINRYQDYLDDLELMVRLVKQKEPELPLVLLGHSQGGLTALSFAQRHPFHVHAMIVLAPALRFAVDVPAWKAALAVVLSRLWPTFPLPAGIDSSLLSHDPTVARAYDQDRLILRKATARWYTESINTQKEVLDAPHLIRMPCLLLQGSDDRIVSPEATRELFRRLGSREKRLKWYNGLYHEVFNEPESEEILAEVVTWIHEQVKT